MGIIHRDIKPANVMLTQAGTVKVMDFGIARAVDDTTSASLTQTATVIGTAQYLSPEQARGESVDARSDIYSTGCVLYELLVGRTPFVGDSALSVAYQHVHEDPLPPSRVNAQVTPEMDAIVLKALAKDPDGSVPDRGGDGDRDPAGAGRGRVLATTQVVAAPLPGPQPTRWPRPGSTTILPAATAVAPPGLTGDTGPRRAVAAPPPEPDEPERRRRNGWVIVAALVALVLLGSGLYWLFTGTSADQVAVPDVVGSSRKEAKATVEAAGFIAQFKNVRGDKATKDQVSGQDPAGGEAVAPGATVTIEMNVGPATAEIPDDLVGEDVEDALASLKKAGFSNVTTQSADSDPADAEPGEVLEVSPEEGSAAAPDEDVVLTVAGVTAPTTERAEPTSAPAPATTSAKPKATKTSKKPRSEPEETVGLRRTKGRTTNRSASERPSRRRRLRRASRESSESEASPAAKGGQDAEGEPSRAGDRDVEAGEVGLGLRHPAESLSGRRSNGRRGREVGLQPLPGLGVLVLGAFEDGLVDAEHRHVPSSSAASSSARGSAECRDPGRRSAHWPAGSSRSRSRSSCAART